MVEYDLYLVMAPTSDIQDNMGELELMLLDSGLRFTRHIGTRDNLAAKRDLSRLVDKCGAMLYISDKVTNQLDLSVDAVEKAEREGIDIVVIRIDDSPYPDRISAVLESAPVFDARNPEDRQRVFVEAIERLGGKVDKEQTESMDPDNSIQNSERDSDAVEPSLPSPSSTGRGKALFTIILEILIAIALIVCVILLASR